MRTPDAYITLKFRGSETPNAPVRARTRET